MASTKPRHHFAPLGQPADPSTGSQELKGIVFDMDGTLCTLTPSPTQNPPFQPTDPNLPGEPQNHMFTEMRAALHIEDSPVDILDHIYSLPPEEQATAHAKIQAIERRAMHAQVPQAGLVSLLELLDRFGLRKAICTRNYECVFPPSLPPSLAKRQLADRHGSQNARNAPHQHAPPLAPDPLLPHRHARLPAAQAVAGRDPAHRVGVGRGAGAGGDGRGQRGRHGGGAGRGGADGAGAERGEGGAGGGRADGCCCRGAGGVGGVAFGGGVEGESGGLRGGVCFWGEGSVDEREGLWGLD